MAAGYNQPITRFRAPGQMPDPPARRRRDGLNVHLPKSGNPLTTSAKRHIELLDLAGRLRCYATDRLADTNAAFLLVHQALAAAFSESPDLRSSVSLEHSLRRDIDRGIASQMGARLSILRP